MATKAPLASLYAEDAEEQLLVDEIKNTYANLRNALENRRQLFDPVLLAAAQGFLAPTKSGSFGESIGNVAALVGPAQEAETKRQMDLAKMRLELAQGELGMRQAARGEEEFRRLLGGRGPAPAGGGDEFVETPGGFQVLRSELTQGGAGKTTSGTVLPPNRPQAENAPSGFTNITPEDIARLASRPGMEGRAKILADMVKMDQDRYAIAMNGTVFDKREKKYLDLPIPGQKQEDFETPFGTFRMLPYEYSQFMNAVNEGRGEEWMKNWRGGQPGAPGRRTVEQIGAAAKAAETSATETAKSEVTRTQEAIAKADAATETMATIRSVRSIASRKDANEIFGIFQTGDFSSFVGNLISERLKVPGASNSFEAGDLVGAYRLLGLNDDQISRYQVALARLATIQLQQAKLAAGQGSVSNFERTLFADSSISPKDTPTTIIAKLAILEARSNFDKEVARELRRSKMSLDEFKDKNEEKYQKMVDSYLDKISGIAMNIGVRPRPGQPRPGTPGQFGPSRDKLKDELGI